MSLPSVWLMYDMTPINVVVQPKARSFLHLLVRFCAVVGGSFAVTGEIHLPCRLEEILLCEHNYHIGSSMLPLPSCGQLPSSPATKRESQHPYTRQLAVLHTRSLLIVAVKVMVF